MTVEEQLYNAAKALIEHRYPTGWGGAAAMRTQTGRVLTSVAPEVTFEGLSLCMEVGAMLEAHKLNELITHSLCLYRENESSPFVIQTPCGICQERLRYWGEDVQAAITNPGNKLVFKSLAQLTNHHWSTHH